MFNVKFADIGEGIHEGIVFKVNVEPNSMVEEGETLFLVETDKVTAEIPSPVSGKVTAVNNEEGDEIHVGETIIVIDDGQPGVRSNMSGEDTEIVDAQVSPPPTPDHVEEGPAVEASVESVEEQGSTSVVGEIEVSSEVIPASQEGVIAKVKEAVKRKVLATPVARKLAKDLGINIQEVTGTGPAGRVMKADIYAVHNKKQKSVVPQPVTADKESYVSSKQMTAKGGHEDKGTLVYDENRITRQAMTMIRKTIAEHMVQSKFTIPHTAVMDEVDVTELVAFRNESKGLAEEEGIKLTYLSLIIKAVTIALKKHPIVNASIDMDAHELLIKHYVNMGIAVDTPQGLMVPVIKDADRKSVLEIAESIDDLSTRAKEKALHLDELHGSSFTITNYGAFGSSFGVPVINYPDAAVLGIGAIVKKPVVIEDDIVVRHILPLSMSFDHRVMDGADAGRFMATLKKLLSTPHLLLLS